MSVLFGKKIFFIITKKVLFSKKSPQELKYVPMNRHDLIRSSSSDKSFHLLYLLSIIFLVTFFFHLISASPTFFQDDSPEAISAAWILGVSHAPSYPLHTLLGACLRWLQVGNPTFSYTFLILLLSSSGSVLISICLWVLLKPIFLSSTQFKHRSWILYLIITYGGFELAFAKSYWSASLSAKGSIYVLQVILAISAFFFALKLAHFPQNNLKHLSNISKLFLGFIFIFSLGFSHHWQSQVLLLPSVFLCFSAFPKKGWRIKGKPGFISLSFCLLVIGFSLYLYLPLRANFHPALNINIPNNWTRFIESITRADARKLESDISNVFSLEKRPGSFGKNALSLVNNISGKALYISNHFIKEISVIPALLCLLGMVFLSIRPRGPLGIFILWALFMSLIANLFYQKLQPVEYWHLDNYLMGNTWCLVILSASGLGWIFYSVGFRVKHCRTKNWILGFGVAFLMCLTFSNSLSTSGMTKEYLYYHYGINILKSLPKNSIYFAETDYDYFSCLYMKFVENKRSDVELVFTPMFKKQWPQEEIKSQYPNLTQKWTNPSSTNTSNSSRELFKVIIESNQTVHPIYFTFSNSIFADMYLKSEPFLMFQPSGLLLELSAKGQKLTCSSHLVILNNFWECSLKPALNNPLPSNVFLLDACAHPYLNTAYYGKARGNMLDWDWCLEKAAQIIQDPIWETQTWKEKGEGDITEGKYLEAVQAFQNSLSITQLIKRPDLAEPIMQELSLINQKHR